LTFARIFSELALNIVGDLATRYKILVHFISENGLDPISQFHHVPFYFNMPICLYKHGFIDLSLILQAVKCHAASSPSKTAANPRPTYAIFS
jgi:hypothetical protein